MHGWPMTRSRQVWEVALVLSWPSGSWPRERLMVAGARGEGCQPAALAVRQAAICHQMRSRPQLRRRETFNVARCADRATTSRPTLIASETDRQRYVITLGRPSPRNVET